MTTKNQSLIEHIDSVYPDDSGDFVAVFEYGDEIFDKINATTATPKEPVAKKQWLFLLDDPRTFVRSTPLGWRDLTTYLGGIPGNVWCGVVVRKPDDVEKVKELRKVRARRLFLIIEEYTAEIGQLIDEHLLAWRCMHCGRRGEGEMPESCPSGSICLGEEWRIQRQIHWIVSEFDFSRYGIPSQRPE